MTADVTANRVDMIDPLYVASRFRVGLLVGMIPLGTW
jgi:hypothetical protein